MFLNNKRRSADAHSQENTCVEFSSSTLLKRDASTGVLILQIFEEHLRTVASKVTLESDCLEFCLWTVTFKTILTWQYYKNTSRFQTRPWNTIQRICHPLRYLLNLGSICLSLTVTTRWKQTLVVLGLLVATVKPLYDQEDYCVRIIHAETH